MDVVYGGLGRHVASVVNEDPKKMVTFLKLLYILDWFYVPSNAMSRISVVALYLRIFTSKLYRGICWCVIAFLLGNMLATILAAQLECFPLAYTWDKSIPNGRCFNQILWYELTNIPNVVGDVMILVLPIPTVWNLKASTGKKAGIAMVFLMGSMYVRLLLSGFITQEINPVNDYQAVSSPPACEPAFSSVSRTSSKQIPPVSLSPYIPTPF